MNILYISALVGGKYAGPTTSVPNQIYFQSKYSNVFWYNLTDIDCPMKKCEEFFFNVKDYPTKKLIDLPQPFSKPDLVVFEEFHKVEFLNFAKQLKNNNIPYVIVPRSQLTAQYMKNKRIKKLVGNILLFNRFLNNATAIQYLSKAEKEDSASHDHKIESFILPNGILVDYKKKNRDNNKITGVFVGRYNIYQKGLDILIEAIKHVKKDLIDNNIVFNLYGPDERTGNKSDVEALVKEANVSEVVKVFSEVYDDKKREVLSNADFFVHTSRYEGMPMSVLEALAYGLPCILSKGTNMTEEIKSYNAGWDAGSSVEDAVNTLRKFINDIDSLEKLSDNALKLSDTYKWESISEKTQSIYEKIGKEWESNAR
ncbi:MAG: glycosyltransferase [Clostridium sp.]|nr:glycosyltransferase [Clostridium sp.]